MIEANSKTVLDILVDDYKVDNEGENLDLVLIQDNDSKLFFAIPSEQLEGMDIYSPYTKQRIVLEGEKPKISEKELWLNAVNNGTTELGFKEWKLNYKG